MQQREEHRAIVDLVGKGGHIRTVPVPDWVKTPIDKWLAAAAISAVRVFRCVCRAGTHWGEGVTERLVWHVVKQYARNLGLPHVAPHDLRRSCAKLCHCLRVESWIRSNSFSATFPCRPLNDLGYKQRIRGAVNDFIGIEPDQDARSIGAGRRL